MPAALLRPTADPPPLIWRPTARRPQVVVRIRPSVTAGAPRWDAENCIHATSAHSVAIAPPEGSQAYKAGDRGQTYSFSRVFDAGTPQDAYYDATAAPLVRRRCAALRCCAVQGGGGGRWWWEAAGGAGSRGGPN